MKIYKIFYREKEICEFDTMKECITFVMRMTKINSELTNKDFSIYSLLN